MMIGTRALLLCGAVLGASCVLPASSSRDARGERDTGTDQSKAPDLPGDRAPDRLVIGPADVERADAGDDAGDDADAP